MDNYMIIMNNFMEKVEEIKSKKFQLENDNKSFRNRILEAKEDDLDFIKEEEEVKKILFILENYNKAKNKIKLHALKNFCLSIIFSIGIGFLAEKLFKTSINLSGIFSGFVGVIGGATTILNYIQEKERITNIKETFNIEKTQKEYMAIIKNRNEVKERIRSLEGKIETNNIKITNLDKTLDEIDKTVENLMIARKNAYDEIVKENIDDLLNEKYEKDPVVNMGLKLERKLHNDNQAKGNN